MSDERDIEIARLKGRVDALERIVDAYRDRLFDSLSRTMPPAVPTLPALPQIWPQTILPRQPPMGPMWGSTITCGRPEIVLLTANDLETGCTLRDASSAFAAFPATLAHMASVTGFVPLPSMATG